MTELVSHVRVKVEFVRIGEIRSDIPAKVILEMDMNLCFYEMVSGPDLEGACIQGGRVARILRPPPNLSRGIVVALYEIEPVAVRLIPLAGTIAISLPDSSASRSWDMPICIGIGMVNKALAPSGIAIVRCFTPPNASVLPVSATGIVRERRASEAAGDCNGQEEDAEASLYGLYLHASLPSLQCD